MGQTKARFPSPSVSVLRTRPLRALAWGGKTLVFAWAPHTCMFQVHLCGGGRRKETGLLLKGQPIFKCSAPSLQTQGLCLTVLNLPLRHRLGPRAGEAQVRKWVLQSFSFWCLLGNWLFSEVTRNGLRLDWRVWGENFVRNPRNAYSNQCKCLKTMPPYDVLR